VSQINSKQDKVKPITRVTGQQQGISCHNQKRRRQAVVIGKVGYFARLAEETFKQFL
jgi:hypothetical protein